MFPKHSRSSRDFLELRQELPKVRKKLANDHEKVVIDEEKFSIDDDIFANVVKALPTLMKSFSPSTNFSRRSRYFRHVSEAPLRVALPEGGAANAAQHQIRWPG
jgi:hypothetical protein